MNKQRCKELQESKEDIYAILVEAVEGMPVRMTRWDVACYCIGYFKKITNDVYECIRKLYADGFIDA